VWFVPLLVVLGHRAIAAGDRAAGVLAAVVLLGTTSVITALPGPEVGPIPRTGLISLFPDTYLVLFLVVLVVMAVVPARDRRFGG
jgi:alpha-1,2-mannosyltransferase